MTRQMPRDAAIRRVQKDRGCHWTEAQAIVESMVERDIWQRTTDRQGIIIPPNANIRGRR